MQRMIVLTLSLAVLASLPALSFATASTLPNHAGLARRLMQGSSTPNATLDTIMANRSAEIKACNRGEDVTLLNSTAIAALARQPDKEEWPELACYPPEVATAVILQERPELKVSPVPPGSAVILNFDVSRVWLWLTKQRLVDPENTPMIG